MWKEQRDAIDNPPEPLFRPSAREIVPDGSCKLSTELQEIGFFNCLQLICDGLASIREVCSECNSALNDLLRFEFCVGSFLADANPNNGARFAGRHLVITEAARDWARKLEITEIRSLSDRNAVPSRAAWLQEIEAALELLYATKTTEDQARSFVGLLRAVSRSAGYLADSFVDESPEFFGGSKG